MILKLVLPRLLCGIILLISLIICVKVNNFFKIYVVIYMSKKELKNFVECASVFEANEIDMSEYRFDTIRKNDLGVEVYVFVRRAKRLGL